MNHPSACALWFKQWHDRNCFLIMSHLLTETVMTWCYGYSAGKQKEVMLDWIWLALWWMHRWHHWIPEYITFLYIIMVVACDDVIFAYVIRLRTEAGWYSMDLLMQSGLKTWTPSWTIIRNYAWWAAKSFRCHLLWILFLNQWTWT